MTPLQRLLHRLRAGRTNGAFAVQLGIKRQAVDKWFRRERPALPGSLGVARLTARFPEAEPELLHLLREHLATLEKEEMEEETAVCN